MAFARFVKKIVSPVAIIVTALLAFTGVAPANATPTLGASNTATTSVDSDWNVGSGNAVNLANSTGMSWYASYESRTTSWQGKTLSLTGGILPAITNASASVGANIQYYKTDGSFSSLYNSGSIYNAVGADWQAVVPTDATRIVITVTARFNSTITGNDVAATLGTTYTPTFAIKLDGVAQTLTSTWSGSNGQAENDVHLTSKPLFTQFSKAGSFAGNNLYNNAFNSAYTCIDTTNLNIGDTYTVHPIVDGADKYGVSGYSTSASVRKLNATSTPSSWVGTGGAISSDQKSTGGLLMFDASFNRFNQYMQSGTNSYALSIQNSASQELNVDCALPALSSSVVPTLSANGSFLAVSVTDSSFANADWTWNLYRASDNALLGTGNAYGNTSPRNIQTCGQSGCTSLAPAGVPVYVKVGKSFTYGSNGTTWLALVTALSVASSNGTLPDPWISVTPVSGGSAAGDAVAVSSAIDYTAASQDPGLMLPTSPQASDGNNGILKPVASLVSLSPPAYSYKLFRIGAAGIDTTFASAGTTGASIGTVSQGAAPSAGWYGSRNKWTALFRTSNFTQTPPLVQYSIYQGTFAGSAVSTPVVIPQSDLNTVCNGVVNGATASGLNLISAPTASQLYSLSCFKSLTINSAPVSASTTLYVTIGSNGAVTTVVQLNTADGTTDTGWANLVGVSNVTASASSDVAFTLIGYSFKHVGTSSPDIVARKGFQIKVDGSVSEVSGAPYASTATSVSTEKTYTFPRTSTGVATTGFLRTYSTGVTTYKWASMSASGVITEGDSVVLDTVAAFNQTVNNVTTDSSVINFVDGQEVGTTGKIQMRRSSGISKVAAITVDLDAKTFDTGEVVTYTNSIDSRVIQLYFVDDQGRMNWMFTSANNKLSLIRWNGVAGGGGALPNGVTVTGVSTKFITNAAAVVTITGTGLNTFTGTKLSIGLSGATGTLVAPTSKAATKLVFTIPAGTSAGDVTVNATFPGGDSAGSTLATVTRVGATKQAQTIVDLADSSANWTGTPITVPGFADVTSVGLSTVIKVAPATLCAVSGTTVSVNGSGTCTVTVSSVGDLGTAAAVSQTTRIVVAPRVQTLSALLTAIASSAVTWTGNNDPITLPTAVSSAGLAVTIAVTPAAICTNVANVITVKASGVCTVSLTTTKDAGTPALAKATAAITVTKGSIGLTTDATGALSNNPADNSVPNTLEIDPSISNDAYDSRAIVFSYVSSNEDICTVDDNGLVTGVSVGSCTVTTTADGGANWTKQTATTAVTVSDSVDAFPEVLAEILDGVSPKGIANNKTAFVATNDKSFLVKWDKVAGLLTYRATGVYTGYIVAETTFTPTNGSPFTCTNVFGTVTAIAGKTAAQKRAAMKGKVFNAATAACKDLSGISVPGVGGVAGSLATDFAKITKVAKVAGNAATSGTKAYETASQLKLKNFTGVASIKITRYRAWPTTMKNKTGYTVTSASKTIPATVRTTVINLQ